MIFFRVAQLHTPTQIITSNLCNPTGLRNVKTYSQCDGKKWWGKKKRNKWLEISWGGISLLNLSISHYLRPWQGTSDQPTANLHCTSEKPPKKPPKYLPKNSRINTENLEKYVFFICSKKCILLADLVLPATTSPVRYIDMTYRLSIYRHFWKISISIRQFWKISISISISIRQFQKYRYRYRYGGFGKYRYR